ncbi:hypothetical protein BOTBODRAFT_27772 [Botryobasidium botryosum FD-172 SS1]|uniref:Amidohydrolase-related domain-containing protein n=1 Tax=Botryobasidium botryosum (strain FD-172 SS1) TaxID=930990 RepID=A0A067N9C7_BOTB1|nr:hypothetical protein BOTBODRAFT_27772 [Botryobasidium botryosum FD-172 SS1]
MSPARYLILALRVPLSRVWPSTLLNRKALAHAPKVIYTVRGMGKNKRPSAPAEEYLHLPAHPSFAASPSPPPIIDTHTHLLSTYSHYRTKYLSARYETIHDFVRALYRSDVPPPGRAQPEQKHVVGSIVDVWCEAPTLSEWKELADSALTEAQRASDWGGMEYWFVKGLHPHEARLYTDELEDQIIAAMAHPRCVGWGEIGLDYHYDNSPRDVQQAVLIRQLRHAVRLGKPLTIHTREADEDIERILKAEVPKDHRIHVHCFTDTPALAINLLDHFPNLFIGITGVITYSTNANTSAVIKHLAETGATSQSLRIVLETDAPYMAPSTLTSQTLSLKSGQKLPFCHSGMIPWTAEFVAKVAGGDWDTEKVLKASNENAKFLYGI